LKTQILIDEEFHIVDSLQQLLVVLLIEKNRVREIMSFVVKTGNPFDEARYLFKVIL
jgi:hypothetical protein